MLNLKSVCKCYEAGAIETTALNDINLEINKGEFVAIMGPSGCGKSTLLNVIGLLDNVNSGSYMFMGKEVAKFNEAQRSDLRKKNIGFIFQKFNLIDELTVLENVQLALRYQRYPKGESKDMAMRALESLSVAHRAGHFPRQLSGGQQQRVAVARAVVTKPKIILADEPTGNLDSENGAEVMGIMERLHDDGVTLVMVTHSIQHAHYAERVIQMKDGKVGSQLNISGKESFEPAGYKRNQ